MTLLAWLDGLFCRGRHCSLYPKEMNYFLRSKCVLATTPAVDLNKK